MKQDQNLRFVIIGINDYLYRQYHSFLMKNLHSIQ